MNQFQITAQREASRRIQERNKELHKAIDESPAKFRAVSGSHYPLHVEVSADMHFRIPSHLGIHHYSSFPVPEGRMFAFVDKNSFEKFLEYLRSLKAQFKATVLPPPQHPKGVLKGF